MIFYRKYNFTISIKLFFVFALLILASCSRADYYGYEDNDYVTMYNSDDISLETYFEELNGLTSHTIELVIDSEKLVISQTGFCVINGQNKLPEANPENLNFNGECDHVYLIKNAFEEVLCFHISDNVEFWLSLDEETKGLIARKNTSYKIGFFSSDNDEENYTVSMTVKNINILPCGLPNDPTPQ